MRKMGIGLGVGINRSNYAQGIFNAYSARVVADGGVVESGTCVDAVSGILLNASLLLIPSGYKANKLYSEIPTNGNGDLTWTRTSTANRTNASGNIESMATGVPRLSYMYGSCPAVLAEPQRTNIGLRSEEFDDVSWTKSLSSATANSTTSPDGSSNADTFIGNGVMGLHGITRTVTVTINTVYTISVYAKKNTNDFIQIAAAAGLFGSSVYANFDLNNGVVGSVGTGATASIQNVGNGWYRCIMTATSGGSVTSSTFGYYLISSSTSARAELNSLATSVYLFGSQFEAGAFQTTYIPTTSATVTRVADTFSRSNIYTNGLISASGGTWFVELRNNVNYTRDNTNKTGITDDTTNFTNSLLLISTPSNRYGVGKYVGGAFTSLYNTTADITKLAIKWNGTTADVFANGTKVVSATSFTPTNMQFFHSQGVGSPTFIQQMALFPIPLSDTDCTTLTT